MYEKLHRTAQAAAGRIPRAVVPSVLRAFG